MKTMLSVRSRRVFATIVFLFILLPSMGVSASKPAARARHGMVVSADSLASEVGVSILRQGGNAVDASVAVGFALAVTYPRAGNIGGGGFMVVRMGDGRTTTFDFRERAPAAATRDMFLDSNGVFLPERSQEGPLSAGVPGSPAGLLMAQEKFGKLKRQAVLAPAIQLAEKGFRVSAPFAAELNRMVKSFGAYPSTAKVFRKRGEWKEGDLLVQRDLAKTLRLIAERGSRGFYEDQTARLIDKYMKSTGGLITLNDLKSYRAVERPPVRGTYRGQEIVSMGPPSSGGVLLIQLLNLLEPFDLHSKGFNSSATIGLMAEAMKLAYADRAACLGDSDLVRVPVDLLISKAYADERREEIDTMEATPSVEISSGAMPANEQNETTHYSVVDRWRNAVSVTTTINGLYGNGMVVEGAGFFLNNEMDDFSAKPGVPNQFGLIGGEANAIAPGKRMLSAMTPTIVVKDSMPWLVVGTPGGSTIITTVLQVILNVIDHEMPLQEAVDAPRIHHQWLPDTLWMERRGLPVDVVENLAKRGYTVVEREGTQGLVEAILVDRSSALLYGATDPRGRGRAVGY